MKNKKVTAVAKSSPFFYYTIPPPYSTTFSKRNKIPSFYDELFIKSNTIQFQNRNKLFDGILDD